VTSQAIRDPLADHLITSQNAALVLIDYQPSQFATVRSMDQDLLRENIVSTVKAARAFGLPIVHSTVNVASGQQQPTVPELAELLDDSPPLDRTTVNSWEDSEFVQAVHATGRRKLIFCALWTEVCMAFAALDALREGYEVYPVVDAIGGTSPEAHRAGSSGSFKPARSRSAGCRSPASCSATGRAARRFPRSSRSCSPTAC
jgi:nicotinamidase-related amidase